MQEVIYIDSIFLVNLTMDLFLLWLTAATLKKTAAFLRVLCAGLLGAFGYCLILCLPMAGDYNPGTVCGLLPIAALMVRMGCRTKGVKELLYGMGILFTYSFLLGGFLLFLFDRIPFLQKHRDSLFLILLAGFLGFLICRREIEKGRMRRYRPFCRVTLPGENGELTLLGLLDTGNGLVEPISGEPAAILEEAVWEQMKGAAAPEKYRAIPYHSIGKDHGIMDGYRLELVEIEYEQVHKELKDVWIAVFRGRLSVKGDYQIILPSLWI